MINIKILKIFTFILLCISLRSQAMEFDRAYLENFAKSFVEQNISISPNGKLEVYVSKIDPRTAIKPCQNPLVANIPENGRGRNVIVKISCSDSKPWSMFISTRIKKMIEVLTATALISKGSVLTRENSNIVLKDQATIRGDVIDSGAGIWGAKAKRSISKGTAVTNRNICLVCKGESVTIIAMSDSFTIRTAGKALESGAIGEQVRVKNKRSGRTVEAKVDAIDRVVISL